MSNEAKAAGETSNDYLGMSDEDFLKVNAPEASAAEAAVVTGVVEETEEQKAAKAAAAAEQETNNKEETETEAEKAMRLEREAEAAEEAAKLAKTNGSEEPTKTGNEDDKAKAKGKTEPEKKDEPGKEAWKEYVPDSKKSEAENAAAKVEHDKTKPAETVQAPGSEKKDGQAETAKAVDYKAFHDEIMKPFKANGREIKLNSPDEAIRLMQMGAGYGRKIQDLQPALKTLRMLEKNDLLDEGKLSFLIDINNKNPDAIKKLIKDAGIDPLDLNMEDNVSYKPVNHSVSDNEVEFNEALKDIQVREGGNETLRVINQTWDQKSKALLGEQPKLLGIIQSQRENGIYDQVAAEIDRQKLLGMIPQTTPFLQAYELAGNVLFPKNQAPQSQNQPGDTPQKQVLATRTETPKAPVQNGDRAAAAAPTKTTSAKKAGTTVNPLEMADDVFMKQFEGRL